MVIQLKTTPTSGFIRDFPNAKLRWDITVSGAAGRVTTVSNINRLQYKRYLLLHNADRNRFPFWHSFGILDVLLSM